MSSTSKRAPRDPFKVVTNDMARVQYSGKPKLKAEAAKSGEKKRAKAKALDPRIFNSSVSIDKLSMNDMQRIAISAMYTGGHSVTEFGYTCDAPEQQRANALLAELGLDTQGREALGSRWSTRWSDTVTHDTLKRVLYQCQCGYDHKPQGSKKRHTPLPFTGCCAHVEVTTWVATNEVMRIRGYFEHNEACVSAEFLVMPKTPLHPSVMSEALRQLRLGATISDLQDQNRRLFKARAYTDQPADIATSPYRWIIQQSDMRTLYRQYAQLNGVDLRAVPEVNIDEWLDPLSPRYNGALADAIAHYAPRAERGDRFEIVISTKEMQAAAWDFVHEKQLIFDGTFGVCNKRILVFIAMGLDENFKGVPVAFLLFSAPTGNKLSSSGYDTAILKKLLDAWKASLGMRNGRSFGPRSAMTDTDIRERAALLAVWPALLLLICRFHLRQCWTNHRKQVLKGDGTELLSARAAMQQLENDLVETTRFEEAQALISRVRTRVRAWRAPMRQAAKACIEHLNYLESYWLKEDLWQSWSDYGRQNVAKVLDCPVAAVAPTSNHLEAFNKVLKQKHLRRWQNGGHRIRLDALVMLLGTRILPSIFEQRRFAAQQRQALNAQIARLPGGATLVNSQERQADLSPTTAWMYDSADRDAAAVALLLHKQVSIHDHTQAAITLRAYSSTSTTVDVVPVEYRIRVGFDGAADCTCPDFRKRGGACKHIRAALVRIEQYRNGLLLRGVEFPRVWIPSSREEAVSVSSRAQWMHHDLTAETSVATPAVDQDPIYRAAAEINSALELAEDFFEPEDGLDNGTGGAPADDSSDSEDEDHGSDTADADSGDEVEEDIAHGSAARAGMKDQVASKLMIELQRLLPKVGDLGDLVNEVDNAQGPLQQLAEQGSTLFLTIGRELGRIACGSPRPEADAHAISTVPPPKRRRAVDDEGVRRQRPRSVSPEVRQVRKPSHNAYG